MTLAAIAFGKAFHRCPLRRSRSGLPSSSRNSPASVPPTGPSPESVSAVVLYSRSMILLVRCRRRIAIASGTTLGPFSRPLGTDARNLIAVRFVRIERPVSDSLNVSNGSTTEVHLATPGCPRADARGLLLSAYSVEKLHFCRR